MPVPAPSPAAASASAGALPGTASVSAPAAAANEKVTIATDLVKATLDSQGATLARVELLKQADSLDHTKNVVLLDESAQRYYVAQTGLVPPAGGAGLPNHHTPMHVVPAIRARSAPGQDELKVQFESAPVGGVKLVKTYIFHRGELRHRRAEPDRQRVERAGRPRLYLQLVRDGNPPPGESSFYFTFTGPAIYTDTEHFKKIDFKSIEKRKAGRQARARHRAPTPAGWRWCSTTSRRPG